MGLKSASLEGGKITKHQNKGGKPKYVNPTLLNHLEMLQLEVHLHILLTSQHTAIG